MSAGVLPFPSQYLGNVTLDFGQRWGSDTEPGIDYGLPVGTPIYAPLAGVVREEDLGKGGWGKRIIEDLGGSRSFGVGHLTAFAVPPGPVQAGQLIGYSGGATSDPSSGISSGPHVEVQLLQGGQFLNPHPFMDALAGGGQPAAWMPGPGGIPIPDPFGGQGPLDPGKGLGDIGAGLGAIGSAIAGIPAGIGHGLADAAGAGTHDVGVFLQRQFVALAVAAVILLVLFAP